jgi:hypothetical protein
MDTSGFYKQDGKSLLYAPNWIQSKDYTLIAKEKDTYTYPVDGWQWFNDAAEAYAANGLPVPSAGDIAIQAQIASSADWDGLKTHLDTTGIYQQLLGVDTGLLIDASQTISLIVAGIETASNIRQLNFLYGVLAQKAPPELMESLSTAIARFNIPIDTNQ